jgi:hypothetical protein
MALEQGTLSQAFLQFTLLLHLLEFLAYVNDGQRLFQSSPIWVLQSAVLVVAGTYLSA